MESFTETNKNQIDINIKKSEPIFEASKLNQENNKDNKSTCNENNNTVNQIITSSNSNAVAGNSIKTNSEAFISNNQQPHLAINDNGKYTNRRNTVQPNLQPLLKKPVNTISTTKPLILPAPMSDSFSQGNKTNIVTMHSNYSTSSMSSQFNNCQQQMAMGIATIQPQHFAYPGLSNNRYPMMPISIQNNYSTQQLTLANNGLGTAVQLMPVMNQNNNQLNNSRVQSLPLFMTPIIGAHNGMLFQPNMTIMPQSNNTMQTINLPVSTYSNEYNSGISIQSQPMYSSGIRNTTLFTTTEIDSTVKHDVEQINKSTVYHQQIVNKPELVTNSKITKVPIEVESTVIRQNVKHREHIRTQIYRMKPVEDEQQLIKISPIAEPVVIPPESPNDVEPDMVLEDSHEADIIEDNPFEIENQLEMHQQDEIIQQETKMAVSSESSTPEPPVHMVIDSTDDSDNQKNEEMDPKNTSPVSLPQKRKLPSPEILTEIEPPVKKLCKLPDLLDRFESASRSPGSLFEKLCKDIPDRQSSIFNQTSRQSSKLTAVVRPEQRKILVHYLDDLIVFESDEPFPTSNKMQVVKSALRAGNIKLNSQKSKLFTDHFLYTNTDDEASPNQQKQKLIKKNPNPMSNSKPDSCMEPLTIDIPTTNTTSSCDSVDSSQVHPLSVCSHRSPTPVPISIKKISKDRIAAKKVNNIVPVVSPTKESQIKVQPTPVPKPEVIPQPPSTVLVNTNKESLPVKQVSPVKQVVAKSGLDRPITEWSVSDVADFVKQTPGCDNYVSMFQNHEIDGEALLLLSNDNLIQGALNMKIGPALKLCARIEKRKALDPPQH